MRQLLLLVIANYCLHACLFHVKSHEIHQLGIRHLGQHSFRAAFKQIGGQLLLFLDQCVELLLDRAPADKLSGQEAFALWARLLRDPEGWGAHFYHNNVLIHLRSNRASAVPYLEAMSQRHPGAVASHLQAAAAAYAGALDELKVADTSKETLRTSEGREELARLVERAARREDQAADRIQAALAPGLDRGP